jgi:dihydroxy-acid dehydratase
MTEAAFRNAYTVLQAIGGSTNAVIHFAAVAARLGIRIDMEAFDRMGLEVPVLVDLKPSGDFYMEHFHWAGGVPKLLKEISRHLDLSTLTVTGGTLADYAAGAEDVPNQTVIRIGVEPDRRRRRAGGAVRQPRPRRRADQALGGQREAHGPRRPRRGVRRAGRHGRAPGPDELDVTADDVLVLRHAGPKGQPACPRPATSRSPRSSPAPA